MEKGWWGRKKLANPETCTDNALCEYFPNLTKNWNPTDQMLDGKGGGTESMLPCLCINLTGFWLFIKGYTPAITVAGLDLCFWQLPPHKFNLVWNWNRSRKWRLTSFGDSQEWYSCFEQAPNVLVYNSCWIWAMLYCFAVSNSLSDRNGNSLLERTRITAATYAIHFL